MTICPICGFNQKSKPGTRSHKQHRFFFGLVDLIWRATCDDLDRPFPNRERVRKWLVVKAGFYTEVAVIGLGENVLPPALKEEMAKQAPEIFFVPSRDEQFIRILKAKSIAFPENGGDIDGKSFSELMNKAITATIDEVLPGVVKDDIIAEIEALTRVPWRDVK